MNASQAMRSKRTVRAYDGRPVPDEVVQAALHAGIPAPHQSKTRLAPARRHGGHGGKTFDAPPPL